jgi:hypothetical protein
MGGRDAPEAPEAVRTLPRIVTQRRPWQCHEERSEPTSPGTRNRPAPGVRFQANRDVPRAAEGLESPDDPAARDRYQRAPQCTGAMVHGSAPCAPPAPPLLTPVPTTATPVHAAPWTASIQPARVPKDLAPAEPGGDAADSRAAWLVQSQDADGLTRRGPTRPSPGGQAPVGWRPGAPARARPPGHMVSGMGAHGAPPSRRRLGVEFARADCQGGPARVVCTRAPPQAWRVGLPPHAQDEAAQAARAWVGRAEGTQPDQPRAGVAGPRAPGIRGWGLRDARSQGLTKPLANTSRPPRDFLPQQGSRSALPAWGAHTVWPRPVDCPPVRWPRPLPGRIGQPYPVVC